MSTPLIIRDGNNLFLGYTGRECGTHRPLNGHASFCYDCWAWCYTTHAGDPDLKLPCPRCAKAIRDARNEATP